MKETVTIPRISFENPKGYTTKLFSNEFRPEITEFVSNVYYDRNDFTFHEEKKELFFIMLKEDSYFAEFSKILAMYNKNNEIYCTARLISKENESVKLPIETEFSVDLDVAIENNKQVELFEVARLASLSNSSFYVINSLFINLSKIIDRSNSMILASLDERVLRKLLKIGYPWFQLGPSKHYLGSKTVPVGMKAWELPNKFY